MLVCRATRNEQRGFGMKVPEGAKQLQSFVPSKRSCNLHGVCREEQATYKVNPSALAITSSEKLEQGATAFATDEGFAVPAGLKEHDSRGGGTPGGCSYFLSSQEGPEFLNGRKHWFVCLNLIPHLFLGRVAVHIEKRVVTGKEVQTVFDGLYEAPIRIVDYLRRFWDIADCQPAVFAVGLIYMERLVAKGNIVLKRTSVHRVVLASLVLAAKFVDDDVLPDSSFCRAGGVTAWELAQLEKSAAAIMDWRLCVTAEEILRTSKLMELPPMVDSPV